MHQTYLFLFTPDKNMDLRTAAGTVFMDYQDRHCDCNNWWEFMGVITGDGRSVIAPESADHFRQVYGKTLPDVGQLAQLALKDVAADFTLTVPEEQDIAEYIHMQIPQRLINLYSKTTGSPQFDYDRSRLSSMYEMFCDCTIKPFTRSIDTPYIYNFYELREDCWCEDATVIRPQDAVLFMDIHT